MNEFFLSQVGLQIDYIRPLVISNFIVSLVTFDVSFFIYRDNGQHR